ncbi:MAG: YfhO family protein [Proteobacteria bacterium]|nr:YfhO family protein [Pseudomonadota bacterium]
MSIIRTRPWAGIVGALCLGRPRLFSRYRVDWIVPAALYSAFILFVFRRVFFPGDASQVFFGWDTLNSYWPDFAYRFRAVWRGEFPLWNPYELGGMPFALNTQTMLFYPPSWLLAAFALPDGRLSVWGPQLFVAFHFLVAALGAHFLARRMGAGRIAAFVAGVTVVLCAPVLTHRNSNFLYPLVWLPWLVIAIDRLLRWPSRKAALGVAVAGILAGSAANPPGVFDVVWACGLFAVASLSWLALRRALEKDRREALRHGRWLVVWGAVAIALVLSYLAITYLPVLDLLGQSGRAQRGMAYSLDRALRFEHLPGLFNARHPQTWWFDLFVGIVPLVALGPALLIKPDRRAWILAALSALSVWVAIGEEGGLLRPALDHLPGFTLNRKAYRYAAVLGIFAGPLAARGLSMVFEVVRTRGKVGPFASRARNRIYAAATVALAAGLVLWFAPGVPEKGPQDAILGARLVRWEALGVCALLGLGLAAPRLGARLAVAFLVVIGATQAAHLYWSAADRLALTQPFESASERRHMRELPTTSPSWRLGVQGPPRVGFGSRELLRYAGGYQIPMQIDRHKSFMRWAKTTPERLRLFNVRYLFSKRPPGRGARPIGGGLWEIDGAVPLVAVYGAVERIPDGQALGRWEAAERRGLALVEERDWIAPLDGLTGEGGKRTAGGLEKYSSNEIVATVDSGARGLAVFNEVYFRGWRAFVDGRESPVVRCNHLLRGVAVDRGKHTVVLRYWPERYGWLVGLLILSVLGLGALAVVRRV